MSNEEKVQGFLDEVAKRGLWSSFEQISALCQEKLFFDLEESIEAMLEEEERPICRVRYEEKDGREQYIFENRQHDEDEFGLDMAFHLQNDMVSYQALTKVREYLRLGYHICFK